MQYDANNRLTNMVDAAGTTRYAYADWGGLLSEDGPWDHDTITYGYTTNRMRSRATLLQPNAADWIQSYAYDAAGRLTNITSPAGAFGYHYDTARNLMVRKTTTVMTALGIALTVAVLLSIMALVGGLRSAFEASGCLPAHSSKRS